MSKIGAEKRDSSSLEQSPGSLTVLLSSLRNLPESDAIALLHRLRGDVDVDVIANALQCDLEGTRGGSLSSRSMLDERSQSRSSEPTALANEAKSLSLFRKDSTDSASERKAPTISSHHPARWLTTHRDAELIEHLMNLYFCWIHPYSHMLSRAHFLSDMATGRTQYCSALLVNAILSLASHYSDRPAVYADPNDPDTAGNAFFAEAMRLLELSDTPSLTTIQALAIMSLREYSRSENSQGYQHAGRAVRMALEMGLHLAVTSEGLSPFDSEVRRVTFWGIFALET